MDAKSLIETLKGRGLSLRVEGDRIKVEALQEPDPETKALLSELRQYREEVKMILAVLGPSLTTQHEGVEDPQATTPESVAASILVETEPDQAGKILRVWKDTLGMTLDHGKVSRDLQAMREWQARWTATTKRLLP